jgi:hypothetical protein
MIVTGMWLVWKNKTDKAVDVLYASVTASKIVKCEVFIDDNLIDCVWAGNGGSHSWWGYGGIGKLIPPDRYPHGIPAGSTLQMKCSGDAAMRVDFYT